MGLWVRLGTNVMVLFMVVIYNVPNKGMFVSGERFHPICLGVRLEPAQGEHLLLLLGKLCALSKNIRLG
jgi:hypothetical protein